MYFLNLRVKALIQPPRKYGQILMPRWWPQQQNNNNNNSNVRSGGLSPVLAGQLIARGEAHVSPNVECHGNGRRMLGGVVGVGEHVLIERAVLCA